MHFQVEMSANRNDWIIS